MNAYFYVDNAHAHGLIVYATCKDDARAAVRREYGYAQLPRRHCIASVSP